MKQSALSAWILLATISFLSVPAHAETGQGKSIVGRLITPGDYGSFVKNWDDAKIPALYALIRTPQEWDDVFHPAPVMGQRKPFCPDPSVYEKQQIIIIAHVVAAPADDQQPEPLQIKEVTENDGVLTVHYQFAEPSKKASYTIKAHLGWLIPKQIYTQVVFVENGKRTTTLNLSEGHLLK